MSTLYVVKRPFRSNGKFFGVGTLIENLAEEVRLGKVKITEGKIARVPDEGPERDALIQYFQVRKGFDLAKVLEERASKGSEVAEPKQEAKDATPPGTPEKSDESDASDDKAPLTTEKEESAIKPTVQTVKPISKSTTKTNSPNVK